MRCYYIYIANILVILFCTSCRHHQSVDTKHTSNLVLQPNDTALRLLNGVLYLHGKEPLNGTLESRYPNGQVAGRDQYSEGKQHGLSETYYDNGHAQTKRWYLKGEKDSIHTGWWPNGNKRFEYHFRQGQYQGLFTEWYESGKPLQLIVYDEGREMSGKGWRENGKLYMNYVMNNGRRYGLSNANPCYSLSKEKNLP